MTTKGARSLGVTKARETNDVEGSLRPGSNHGHTAQDKDIYDDLTI